MPAGGSISRPRRLTSTQQIHTAGPVTAATPAGSAAPTSSIPWEALFSLIAVGPPEIVRTLYPAGYSFTPSPVVEETTVTTTVAAVEETASAPADAPEGGMTAQVDQIGEWMHEAWENVADELDLDWEITTTLWPAGYTPTTTWDGQPTTTTTFVDPETFTTAPPAASTFSSLSPEGSKIATGISAMRSILANGETANPLPAAETSLVNAPAAPVMDLPVPTGTPDAPKPSLHARDAASPDAAAFDAAIAASAATLRDHLAAFNAAFEDPAAPDPTERLSPDTLAVLKHAGREILLHGLHRAERDGLPALNRALPPTAVDFLDRIPGNVIADFTAQLQRGQPIRRSDHSDSDSDSDNNNNMDPNDPLGSMGFKGDDAWAAYPVQCQKYMEDHPNSLCPLLSGMQEFRRRAAKGALVERGDGEAGWASLAGIGVFVWVAAFFLF